MVFNKDSYQGLKNNNHQLLKKKYTSWPENQGDGVDMRYPPSKLPQPKPNPALGGLGWPHLIPITQYNNHQLLKKKYTS